MLTKDYLETINLPEPNWAALSSGINRAIRILEDKKDKVTSIMASNDSLNALELALSLNDGSSVEGTFKGIQLIPNGAYTEGDFVISGVENSILVMCDPWDPYWVEEHIRVCRRDRQENGESDHDPDLED